MGLLSFNKKNSISEREQEKETNTEEIDIMRQRLMLKELKERYGSESWKNFSNGKKSGIDFSRIYAFFNRLGSQKF